MEKSELLKVLSSLAPSKKSIPQALAFLRLTARNNKSKKADDLRKRSDIITASSVIGAWISTVEQAADEIAKTLPKVAAQKILASVDETLTKLKAETSLSNMESWQKSDNGVAWASRIVLRMTYLLNVLEKQVDLTEKGKYRIWVCSFSPTSCKYCKAMHGTVVSRTASFKKYAIKAGFKNVYGGLHNCPLHPNCKCVTKICDKDGNILT